jgi:hypothetical protein
MDLRVRSWNELTDRLYEGSWKPGLGRFRSNFAYRGMKDAADDLTTTLFRLGGAYARAETHLIRNFRKYAHRDSVPGDSVWNWLALGQHHGLPTRLLDWTFSPFVALHFVTQNLEYYDVDGVVWCVDYTKAHAMLPRPLRKMLQSEQADVFTTEMLDRAADSLAKLQELGEREPAPARKGRSHAASNGRAKKRRATPSRRAGEPFALFLEPPSLDDRIVNQFALMSMMSSAEAQFEPWLERHPGLYRRIIVPAKLKWEVRDKLDQANITERVLFPGLDGLCRWQKRYYSPRSAAEQCDEPQEQDAQGTTTIAKQGP